MSDIFQDAISTLQSIADEFGIQSYTIDYLSKPEILIETALPLKMDDGRVEVFTGYRSRHSTILGPAKGGVRFHPGVTKSSVNNLALSMTVKTSLAGLPYGGGKGAIMVDPDKLSSNEVEKLSRAYIRSIYPYVGPNSDVMAPDVNTNAVIMGWMADEYQGISGQIQPSLITGKPVALGGSLFRNEATGYGVYTVTELAMKKLSMAKDSTVAIQGFGNVGALFAKYATTEGNMKVVAISDVSGAVYCKEGLNIDKINSLIKSSVVHTSTLAEIDIKQLGKNVDFLSKDEIFGMDVDILVLAAVENAVTEDNRDQIKAKCIIEGANSPVAKSAYSYLESKGVTIVPGVIANSGGVIVSYFEWVQNLQGVMWPEDRVSKFLVEYITKSFDKTWAIKESKKVSFKSAAYYIGLSRIEEALKFKYNMF